MSNFQRDTTTKTGVKTAIPETDETTNPSTRATEENRKSSKSEESTKQGNHDIATTITLISADSNNNLNKVLDETASAPRDAKKKRILVLNKLMTITNKLLTFVGLKKKKKPADLEAGENAEGRQRWGSSLQFILTCIGYAVGLGNIWRFPALAFKHGGAAFLIPYVCCSFFFGFPLLYFELSIGQYLQSGPSKAFYKFKPIFQGIGWTMTFVSLLVGTYYSVIIAWVGIYLYYLFTFQYDKWTTCKNEWNNKDECISILADQECLAAGKGLNYSYHGECVIARPNGTYRAAAEEFFEKEVLRMSDSIESISNMNWQVFSSLAIMWILIAFGLWKGVRHIGKISLFTATVPYVIIAILFVRGVTLEHASDGINFYLLKPDFSHVLKIDTWRSALIQVCFSLSVGFGGLLSMASYNQHTHNCFRDAVIVAFADSFMAIFGGIAVFSTTGYLAHVQGKNISEVIREEAIATMNASWLWAFLFFLMLFLLGISTQFVYAETVATSLMDQFPRLKPMRAYLTTGTCILMFLIGIIMCTDAGIYWFIIFNDYTGSFSVCVACVAEIVCVLYFYGPKNWRKDLQSMFGEPKYCISKWIGRTGYYFMANWMVVSPLLGSVIFVFTCWRTEPTKYGNKALPIWADAIGWILGLAPSLCIPIFAIVNIGIFARKGDWKDAFRVHESHRSYLRVRGLLSTKEWSNREKISYAGADEDDGDAAGKSPSRESSFVYLRTARSSSSRLHTRPRSVSC
ncbi:unnamed protein product, partial [Mesorhabditis belari]|uniref:Uncharacterized protein n=1 Tax=Mesorhabditis belari TaxID=2138241 RepID=A0AAF3F4K2_9BILA